MKDRSNFLGQVGNGQVGEVRDGKERVELLGDRFWWKEMIAWFRLLSDELKWAKAELKRELREIKEVLKLFEGKGEEKERAVVSLSELSDWELELVREFIEWMWDNIRRWEWLDKNRERGYEGYDPRVQRLYLQRKTLQEFFGRIAGANFNEREVKRVLAKVGILEYKEEGGRYQYTKLMDMGKWGTVSTYVVDVGRAIEVGDELRDEIVRRERVQELKGSEVSRIQIPESDDDLSF